MSGSVNKAILIGRCGKEPETRQFGSGAVTSFSLATNERYKDKSGQKQEKTEWHNIVCWNKLAELTAQHVRKGSALYVEGKIQTRSWDDNSGNKRYSTEINAHIVQFLDNPQNNPQRQSGNKQVNNGNGQQENQVEDGLPF